VHPASADVMVENVLASTDKLVFKASSGSQIKTDLDAPEVRADASSGATITLSGKTKAYNAESVLAGQISNPGTF